MNHLINITKKEVRELFTPGTVASVVFVIAIFIALGQGMSGQTSEVSRPAHIAISLEEDPGAAVMEGEKVNVTYDDLVRFAYGAVYGDDADPGEYVHYLDTGIYGDREALTRAVEENGYKYAIGIPSSIRGNIGTEYTVLPVYYCYRSSGAFASVTSTTAALMVAEMQSFLATDILLEHGEDHPSEVQYPVLTSGDETYTLINGTVYTDITPQQLSNSQMGEGLMIPIIVMIVITMVGSIVITSMGTEKENKTLETLLTMPVRRTTIVTGKLLAAAIMGLFYGVCYLAGMMFYSKGITSGLSSVNLNDYGLGMTPMGWAVLFLILFLALFSALGICMILGAFTKNYKMAQTMIMPITVLSILPMMVFMFSGWNSMPGFLQGVIFAIPFSHPMMAMTNIVMGDTLVLAGGIAYLAVLDLILVMITVRVYNSDILITGVDFKNLRIVKGIAALGRRTR